MIKVVGVKNIVNGKSTEFRFKQPEKCPICSAKIVADDICGCIYSHCGQAQAAMLNYCSGCQSCFISTYEIQPGKWPSACALTFEETRIISSDPICFECETFSNNLTNMSSLFVEIYNQARQAESLKMDHIAGVGYRKALEFLIKDYSIHFNNNQADAIKTMPLVQCIKTYIDSHKIKTLAEKSAWLGNDEVHYIRKHADKDVEDLKRFISACVSYIDMELIIEEAEAIQKA